MIICSILSSFSASQMKPKFCIDCKFYKKDFFTSTAFGTCTLFPIERENDYFLVNGNNNINNNMQYHYCSTSREFEHMCGKQGKFYENNEKKN